MNGYEFEYYLKKLFKSKNYKVKHTPLSNDQGADLIVEKDNITTVIQAKRYSKPVGNKAVQEVIAAKQYYNCHRAIGKRNDTVETAKFVPASPETTPYLMKNLFKFLEKNEEINPLFKIALAHYHFEAIHPFRDGNGRLGRLLIILYLLKENILKQPLLYMSEYFNNNRDDYVDKLFLVSSESKTEDWLEFFLKALNTQSKRALDFAVKLDIYKKDLHNQLKLTTKSIKIFAVIDLLFKNPFITINEVKDKLEITYKSAQNLISILEEENIVKEITGKDRNKIYLAREILNILKI